MGVRNYLIDGGSCTGKTSVCAELRRRGHHAVNGDTELAYQGDPNTGQPIPLSSQDERPSHWNHLWDIRELHALINDRSTLSTFFCGGSRNLGAFVDLFDAVLVLQIDRSTLCERLDRRPQGEFGGLPDERDLILRLHRCDAVMQPHATGVDATAPVGEVVDEILSRTMTF